MTTMTITREEWLTAAMLELEPWFETRVGHSLPPVRVSVGFPAGVRGGTNSHVIGQCFAAAATADGRAAIFVSPVLDDSVRVLETLTHELVHAITPGEGHRGEFASIARKVGLVGKLTTTTAGDELRAELTRIAAYLGDYRDIHGKIDPHNRRKQGTRMLRAHCDSCDFVARVTARHASDIAHFCQSTATLRPCIVDRNESGE